VDWDKDFTLVEGDLHRDGDGRVPLASALLEDVRETRFIKAVHGSLPVIPAVYDDVFCWLNGEEMNLPRTAAGAHTAHLAPGSGDSDTPALDGSARARLAAGDPGYWNLHDYSDSETTALERGLVGGNFPEFERIHIL